jgi:hypothetical protein
MSLEWEEYRIHDPNLLFLGETDCCTARELCDKLVAIGAMVETNSLKVQISSLGGSFTVKLDANQSDVLTLKTKIFAHQGVAVNRQRLVQDIQATAGQAKPAGQQTSLLNSDVITESCSLTLYVRAPPKHPTHPKDEFTLFANAVRPILRKTHPCLSWKELSQEITDRYDHMDGEEQTQIGVLAADEIQKWEVEMDEYDPAWRIKREQRRQQEERDRADPDRRKQPFQFNFREWCC